MESVLVLPSRFVFNTLNELNEFMNFLYFLIKTLTNFCAGEWCSLWKELMLRILAMSFRQLLFITFWVTTIPMDDTLVLLKPEKHCICKCDTVLKLFFCVHYFTRMFLDLHLSGYVLTTLAVWEIWFIYDGFSRFSIYGSNVAKTWESGTEGFPQDATWSKGHFLHFEWLHITYSLYFWALLLPL